MTGMEREGGGIQSLTLLQLNRMVTGVLDAAFEEDCWVQGELLEGRVGAGGHFYGELVQRDAHKDAIVAKARLNVWVRNFQVIRYRFEHETGQTLRAGLHLLLKVHVTFHEVYGYSLNVVDIDPRYTLGDMARRRREILQQLETDGIIDDNRELPLPRLLKRIAVISSEHAAGYGDFCNQLLHNEYGLAFRVQLFPALMQGAKVEESVLGALEAISAQADQWDVVVIIRGGGAVSDLSDFDSYPLAVAITQCELPVFTGIGHDRDETVLDRVAHTALKTPTAVAAYILDHQVEELSHLQDLQQRLSQGSLRLLERENTRLSHWTSTLPLLFQHLRERQLFRLQHLEDRWRSGMTQRMERERYHLQLWEQRVQSLDPSLLLQRGYSMTLFDGKVVTDASTLHAGDVVTTCLANGVLTSRVEGSIKKKN